MDWARLLFSQGFGTRRECEALVAAGRVMHAGHSVTFDDDVVPDEGLAFEVDGQGWPYHERALILLPCGIQRSRRRGWIGGRGVEQQAVREAAGDRAHYHGSTGERLAVDLQPGDAPRAKRQRAQLQAQQLVEIAVLRLEMLWGEEGPLAPEDEIER